MQRYPYRQQPQMVDTGDVPYVSYISEQAEPLMMQAAANAQQRYDLAQTAIAKYLEENAAAKFRDADYNTAMAKLNQDLEDIKTKVKDRYDGQYWQAYPEIVKRLSKARQTYHLAQKAYEEEQKYAPLITKLAAEKKLIFAPNAKGEVIDPRTQSVFDETGQYRGGLDYSNIRERSDYDKIIEEAIVKGIDKTAVHSGLINSETAGYLLQLQRSGLAALGNTEQEIDNKIDKIAEEYAPIFEKQTTYGIDPDKSVNSKEYVKDAIYRLASSKTGRQYVADRNYDYNPSPSNPNNPAIIHPYDTIVKPGNKNEKISSIEDRFSSFRKNSKYVTGLKDVETKREELAPKIDINNVSNVLKPLGLTQFTTNALTSIFNDGRNINSNAVQGILETYSEFYPEEAEKYLDKDSSGKYSFKTSINARGLVANDFIKLVNEKPFERIDKYVKEQNEYFSKNHGLLKQAFDEGKITQEELFNLAEQSEREKALTFDVGIIPKDDKAIEEINDMARFISSKATIVDEGSGEERSSKKTVWEEITERGGIYRWTYNPLDGTIDYWTKNGGVVRTDINKNGTKVVKEISGIISSTIDSYYKNDVNETSISLPVSYIDEHEKVQTLKVKVVKQFDPVNKTIIKRIGVEEFQPDGNIRIRKMEPDEFINHMFTQIELFKGERIQQKSKDPNKQ